MGWDQQKEHLTKTWNVKENFLAEVIGNPNSNQELARPERK